MYALVISLLIHSLLILPLHAKKSEVKAISLSIKDIEFVPSKVMEQETVVVKKSFHGKPVKRKVVETVNKELKVKGNKEAEKYFTRVREVFLKNSSSSTKAQKLKLKGEVLVKIQIQKNGSFDILYVGGENTHLVELANETLSKIESFPEIPDNLGQQEIQLKVPLVYKFN